MRSLMMLGGMIGFAIGIALGMVRGSAWPSILWHASVAALVAGLLLRWWGNFCVKSLRQAHRERGASSAKLDSMPDAGQAKV